MIPALQPGFEVVMIPAMTLTTNGNFQFTLKTKLGFISFGPSKGSVPAGVKMALFAKPEDAPENLGLPQEGEAFLIASPGEYEAEGISVFGYRIDGGIGYVVHVEDVAIAYLGELRSVPNDAFFEQLGSVDVLIVPGCGNGYLDGKAVGAIARTAEPGYVVPSGFAKGEAGMPAIQEFLKAYGVAVEPQPSLNLAAGSIPEQTAVVVLR